jgi:hypothetical protein
MGGLAMKNRLACAALLAAVFSITSASAQNWEVTKLVPGSAFHGASGVVYFSSDIENAIYKAVKK